MLKLVNAYHHDRATYVLIDSIMFLAETKEGTCITAKNGATLWVRERPPEIYQMIVDSLRIVIPEGTNVQA
jgi:hypothetical protein